MAGADPSLSMDARQHFLQALRRMLRPIIRMLIRHGIRYHEFADVARGAYVESAVRDGINGVALNSRDEVAVATGIPRQRVDHYIDDEGALATAEPTLRRVVTGVLHKWNTHPRYLGADHQPLELEYEATDDISFKSLVEQVDSKANCGEVAEELARSKCITYSEDGRLRVVSHTFLWQGDWPHAIENFGVSLADLMGTLEYNRNPDNAEHKRLERFVSADHGVPARLLSDFQTLARQRANQFLVDLDDWLALNCDSAGEQQGPRADCGVNVFLYVDPPEDSRSLSTLIQPGRQQADPREQVK